MPHPYISGRSFEYRVRRHLEREGYFVVRSSRSKGPADLVALKRGSTLLVQCKRRQGDLSREEASLLVEAAEKAGAEAIVAYADRKNRTVFEVL